MSPPPPLALIVDDDPDAAFLIRRLFKKLGRDFEVLHWSDAERAYDYFCAKNDAALPRAPRFVVLDVKMPKVNGFEVLEAIRSGVHAKVPVVILTTSDDPSDQRRAKELGADAYMAKFPGQDEFRALIDKLVRRD